MIESEKDNETKQREKMIDKQGLFWMAFPEYQRVLLVITWKRLVFANQKTCNVSKIHSEFSGKTAQNFLLKA